MNNGDVELIAHLQKNIFDAHEDFELYKKLFYNSGKVDKLLKNTAHNFFYRLEEILADRCIIGISKLTDPYKQGSNKNLSLDILRVIGEKEGWPFLHEIEVALKKLDKLVESIRDHRNKLKSHNDIKTLKNPWALKPITIDNLEKAYIEIGNLMNLYYLEIEGYQFNWYPKSPGNVGSLLAYLEMGRKYEEQNSSIFK